VVVDFQNDFCPGGVLAVPGADAIIPAVNTYIRMFSSAGLPVVFTRDWHPPDHSSFREHGGPWPAHCVRGTHGAQIHDDIAIPPRAIFIDKGTDRESEGYSGFESTPLEEKLRRLGVRRIFVAGLATDYCVKHTALDALERGFDVVLLLDATKGIGLKDGDIEGSIEQVVKAGGHTASIDQFELNESRHSRG